MLPPSVCELCLIQGAVRSMNRGAMNLDYSRPYFNMSVAACRKAGGRGGRRSATSRRLRQTSQVPVQTETEPQVETAAEAIARIDALCPWLRGAEGRSTRRREA